MAALGLELMAAFEEQVSKDIALNFKGTARVRFANLVFPDPVRLPSPKDVERLEREFAGSGCLQDHTLKCELERLGITAKVFKDTAYRHPPELQLPIGTTLYSLNGQHRILAGAAFLRLSERWWTVDLYREG